MSLNFTGGVASQNADTVQIKDDPEPSSVTRLNMSDVASTKVKVKKEEPDDEKIDAALLDGGQGDMFEDVDAPEIVDLTYEGIAEIDGVDHFVCEDFKIPQIPKPMIVTRPLKSLFDCIDSGHIVLDPDYQREVVWDEGRASLLITSILMGYFIPPIIFNVKSRIVNRNGTKEVAYTRICVDGKQRLTSVHKFMKGQIGFFDSNFPQKKWYFCHPVVNGRETFSNHNILPRAVKEFFIKQAFCCYEYAELTLETEETMFQLVQRGIALTPAEKMRAMSTEWATFTKQYEDDYMLIVNLSKQNRASGFRLVLTIFTMIQEVMSGKRKRSSAPTLQASPQALLKVLDDKAPIEDGLKLKFKAIFDCYENLVKLSSTQITATRFKINNNSVFDPAPDFLRAPGVEHVRTFSPLELIATAILVSYHMESLSDQEMLEHVKAMRIFLRLKHKDLRVNAQCWLTVWEFVTEEITRRQNATNEAVDNRASLLAIGSNGKEGHYASPYATLAPNGAIPSPSTPRKKTRTSSIEDSSSVLSSPPSEDSSASSRSSQTSSKGARIDGANGDPTDNDAPAAPPPETSRQERATVKDMTKAWTAEQPDDVQPPSLAIDEAGKASSVTRCTSKKRSHRPSQNSNGSNEAKASTFSSKRANSFRPNLPSSKKLKQKA